MKNIAFIGICILLLGCNKSNKTSYTIAGHINDPKVSIVKLVTADSTFIDSVENNAFKFSVNSSKEEYIYLKIGRNIPIYAKPGDSICLDYINSANINFSGMGFYESQFIYEKNQLIKKLGFGDPRKIDIALFSSEASIFKAKIDSIKHVRIDHLNNFKRQYSEISSSFTNIEHQLINYFEINKLFGYPGFYTMLNRIKPSLPENYYDFIKNIDPNINKLLKFNDYKSTLSSYLNHKSETFIEKYNIAKDLFTDKDIFEEIIFKEINSHINFNGIDNIDSICKEFINSLSNKKRKEYLLNKYDSWKKLAKGIKAPDFEIKDNKGNIVKLSDFKGKYIYIDCWNSHCGPCLSEMPTMKKLSEDLSNENIIFISISGDRHIDRWQTKLKELKLNTINLCTEGPRHKFIKDFNIRAFPRYILIDNKGFIIDATAKKPSLVKEELIQIIRTSR